MDRKVKVLEINATNTFSTGNIMFGIAEVAKEKGYDVYTASKYTRQSKELENLVNHKDHYLIGSRWENTLARYFAWYTDIQDFGPKIGTRKLIKKIKKIKPDIIHLHDIVGWYIDIGIFFEYLKKINVPVIWTMHCCWAYTGRCIYYDAAKCYKWKIECNHCPQRNSYPYSKIFDKSRFNYKRKKKLITSIKNINIVTPSEWLKSEVKESFLKDYPVTVINNGIDLELFKPRESNFRNAFGLEDKKIVLFVAAAWSERKGLKDALEIAKRLDDDYKVVVVGLSKKQEEKCPDNVISLGKIRDIKKLTEVYTQADVFVNPTYEDNFPTVNIEAQACGTPVITYNTGGSGENIDLRVGEVIEKGNVDEIEKQIKNICKKETDKEELRKFVESNYSKKDKFLDYIKLYQEVLND